MSNPDVDNLKEIFNKALKALVQKDFDTAQSGFEEVISINPRSAEAYLNLGSVYFYRDNLDQAIEYFKKAIENDSTMANAYINMANCYFKKEEYQNAIGYWTVASNLVPSNSTVHQNLAVAYEKTGKMQKAFYHYEQFLVFNRRTDSTASKIKRKVQECKKVGYHNLDVGVKLQKANRLSDAATAYIKSIQAYPNISKAHLNLGSIFYKSNKFEEAIEYWTNAVRLDPEHANTHCNLGIAYDKLQKYDEAAYHYMKYLELTHGQVSDADTVKARVDELKAILQSKKELIKQHLNKGNNLLQQKNFVEAIEEYSKYIALSPPGPEVDQAKKRLDEAKERQNPVEKARERALELGDEYFNGSLYDKAITAYQRYLNLNPSPKEASEIKKKLELCHKQISNVVSAMLSGGD